MASAAEQMAANLSWGALGKATDLRQRIFFTLGLLIVYRLGTYIPVPGIDGQALRDFMSSAGAGLGGILNMFTGGALGRMAIFALNIMPYISASIIIQLLTSMVANAGSPQEERGRAGPQEDQPIHPLFHRGSGRCRPMASPCRP
jgi:preprotein translocase subunit SecY